MAEFQKVAKARKRMCDSYETCSNGCPVGKMLNGIICSSWMVDADGNPLIYKGGQHE